MRCSSPWCVAAPLCRHKTTAPTAASCNPPKWRTPGSARLLIGDEYFGAGQDVAFVDLDVLATGAVVPEVSADFDSYWDSASAYPVAQLLPKVPPEALDRLTTQAKAFAASPNAAPYFVPTDSGTLALTRLRQRGVAWRAVQGPVCMPRPSPSTVSASLSARST